MEDIILLEEDTDGTQGALLEEDTDSTSFILLEYVAAPTTSNQGIMMMGVGA